MRSVCSGLGIGVYGGKGGWKQGRGGGMMGWDGTGTGRGEHTVQTLSLTHKPSLLHPRTLVPCLLSECVCSCVYVCVLLAVLAVLYCGLTVRRRVRGMFRAVSLACLWRVSYSVVCLTVLASSLPLARSSYHGYPILSYPPHTSTSSFPRFPLSGCL